MVDRETNTFWSQVTGRAIDGPHRGAQLEKLEAIETSWEKWRKAHPETQLLKKSEEVLSSHYQSYFDDPEKMGLFRAQWLAERMPGKALVYGAAQGAHAVAVTGKALDGQLVTADLRDTPLVFARARDGGVRAFVASIEGEKLGFVRNPKTGEVRDAGGSVWDLDSGRCTSGPRSGLRLESVAVTPVYWFAWSSFYPNTQVVD